MSLTNKSLSTPRFKAIPIRNATNHIAYYYSKCLKNQGSDAQHHLKDSDLPNPEGISKKYFGKKIYQISHLHPYSRRPSYQHSKNFRKLSFPISCSSKPFLIALERICFNKGNNSKGDVKSFRKSIAACKYLDTIHINEEGIPLSIHNIRKFRSLESLTFYIKEDHICKNFNAFRGLKSLKSVNIIVQRQDFPKNKSLPDQMQIKLFISFCRSLLNLSNLKFLKLNLHDSMTSKYPILLESLLGELSHTRLCHFNIQSRLSKVGCLSIEKIDKSLGQVEFLGLRALNTNSKFIIFDGSSLILPGTTYNEEINSFKENKNKILDIHFKDVSKLDIGSIITKCTSLQTLGLHFGNNETAFTIPHDLSAIKKLKHAIFSFEGLNSSKISETIPRLASMLKGTNTLESISLLVIFSKLKDETLIALNTLHQVLKMNKMKSYTFQFRDKFKFRKNTRKDDVLEVLSRQITGLTKLEYLKIEAFVHNLTFLQETKNMLASLRNLKKLHLSIKSDSDNEQYPVSFYFPFEELRNLTEFRLRLKFPLLHECAEHLVRNMSKLKDIEVLEIMEGTLQDISLSSFCEMLKELSRLTKLRELIINAKINEREEKCLMSAKENEETCKEDNITHRLKKETEKLFYSNPKLENVHIYHSRSYNIKYTR